jgi:hypothetical protein
MWRAVNGIVPAMESGVGRTEVTISEILRKFDVHGAPTLAAA